MKKNLIKARILQLTTLLLVIVFSNFQNNIFSQCYVPSNVTASPTTVSCGNATSLNATATGNSIAWYTVPTGGAAIGFSASGANLSYIPASTTTFWAEGYIGSTGSVTYSYTGAVQTFSVPLTVLSVSIVAYGAQGGNGLYSGTTGIGGFGGLAQGTLAVTPGSILYVYVGQQGQPSAASYASYFNGGGVGYGASTTNSRGGGGGGTDIRVGGTDLTNRVLVAGGGGGAWSGSGGDGGGLSGSPSPGTSSPGGGGTQTGGGANGCSGCCSNNILLSGSLGQGGSVIPGCTNTIGGGGGGYYGGGAGNGGGGGSSYIGGVSSGVTTTGVRTGDGQVVISWNGFVCASTSRTSVTVYVNPPASPTVTASPTLVCSGQVSGLSGTAPIGIIRWWDSQTGGNMIGTSASGASFVVTPTTATVYYAEVFASCGTSTRTPDSVFIGTLSAPTIVTATPNILNCGIGSSSLSGQTLAQNIAWYDSPSGGNLIGSSTSGNGLSVYPISTTAYYAEAQNRYIGSQTFAYTGSQQTFTVPMGILSIDVDVQGAQGGTNNSANGVGGLGGRVSANLSVTPGQLLYINVGGQGSYSTTSPYGAGWNGGGSGGYTSYYGGGGGGASDIRSGGTALGNRIIVAAGGGGACGYTSYYNGHGGVGGDLIGGYGLYYGCYYASYSGNGGSQTAGGTGGTSGGGAGSLGIGGNAFATYGGGGGGGGYYGGGGGYYYGGGGGGSNYVSPTGTTNVVTYQGNVSGNGQVIISWNSLSCNSTSRTSVTVTVNSISSPPTNVTATPSTIICGNASSLNGTSAGYTIGWFNQITGGNRIGTSLSGTDLSVTPTTTTTYYAEAESIVGGALTFSYTGSVQTWVVPINTSSIIVDVLGAQGGSSNSSYGTGGNGGRVQATVPVTAGQKLYFYIGQQGSYYSSYTGTPAFNGGGMGGWSSYYGGCGGGASDIRTVLGSLSSRLIVSGGGGGGNGYSSYPGGNGGAGGGLVGGNGTTGYTSYPAYVGYGGTQTSGGIGGTSYGGSGILGIGGNAYYSSGGGGGGGGYYGGGGAYSYSAGGGGSSWTSSGCSSVNHTQGYTTGNGQIIISWNTIQCASTRTPVTLTVNPPSNPTNVISSPSTISCGGYSNLSASASNGIIRWWTASTGGTLLGSTISGGNFSIYPPGTTTVYYAESFTTCTSPQRISDTVYFSTTIGPLAAASPSTICTGGLSNLVAIAPGNIVRWFDSPYGGTLLATSQSGVNYTVLPTTSTTYYAEGYIGSSGSVTFNYTTSSYVTWTVPLGAMSVNIDASGAQGGTFSIGYGTGGLGGRVQTILNTIPGQVLYINIGQQGQSSIYGGWWGGGTGGSTSSAGGGGGTDIRVGGTAVSNRVIVAGAGGGNCGYSVGTNNGGGGGGTTGGNGLYNNAYNVAYCGGGGTQTTGGLAATYTSYIANPGILGKGGNQTGTYGGGGGGGYYGGGAGSYYGGGGGGSSWADPSLTLNTSHTQGYQSGNGQVTISWNVAPCSGGRTALTINIGTPADPTNVTSTPSSLSCGSVVSLNASTNGFLATWWDSPSGGNLLGTSLSGNDLYIVPTATTTYYVESDAFSSVTQTFGYTGNVQTLTVPTGVVAISVDAGGAQGSAYDTTIGIGGFGGRLQTTLSVTSGQILYIRIGGQGAYNTSGWNGGGCGSGCSGLLGGGGGGATDIRIGGITLSNRVLVAGGGGGGGYGTSVIQCNGGAGGSTVAGNGSYNGTYDATRCGSGGTQISGGTPSGAGGLPGSFGIGGNSGASLGEGGGGGGYYGGGGASNSGGGGGGSSWSDPNLTSNTIHTQGYKRGDGFLTLAWNSILCYSTNRVSISVTVTPIPDPTTVSSNPSSINCSASSNINGSTSNGLIRWWNSSTGGNILGSSVSGVNLTVSPSVTTIYYAESYQIPCVSALRVSIAVTVVPIASPAVTATPPSYCTSGTSNLNAISAGNLIKWWTAFTGGYLLTTSQSGANYSVSPSTTTTYYAESSQFNAGSITFNYSTSNFVTWTVPNGATTIGVDASGAQGCASSSTTYGTGGLGGRVQTTLSVTSGQMLYIYVGSQPSAYTSPGGFNGGANGSGTTTYYGGSGGGASDIRIGAGALTDRVIVAGGGGGSGYGSGICSGGAGGGPTTAGSGLYAGSNNTTYCGQGGSLAGGGAAATYTSYVAYPGTLGIGGAAATYYGGGGGGGGFYGGGGGSYYGGGGGGSSYVNTSLTSTTTHTQGYRSGNGQIILSWNILQCVSNRTSVTVTVNINSTPATAAAGTPNAICPGTSTTLSLTGGTLSTGANWYWYKGACGGSVPTVGSSVTVSPTATSVYYVRAQGSCNTTACISTTIILNTNSVTSDSVSINPGIICIGSGIIVNRNGGTLGTGSNWFWYTGSCGGTLMGTGISITDIPSSSTTYFVRAEGTCNSTVCKTKTVIVYTNSVNGSSAAGNPPTICSGGTTTLDVNGGQLGTGGNWFWFTGSCGGTLLGTGSNFADSPLLNTIYYVRGEGICNTTNCISTSVTLNTASTGLATIVTSQPTICAGSGSTLGLAGGSLGVGATWSWYSGSCGGTYEGNDTLINVMPTATTIYFVRAENVCNSTSCVSQEITVNDTSTSSTGITAIQSTICAGTTTTLTVNGGSLGTSSSWYWYIGNCGGTSVDNGSSITVSPALTSDYYVRAEGICNTTSCVNMLVTVNDSSVTATSIVASPDTICESLSSVLTVNGGLLGTSAEWYWYSGTCGGTLIGSGSTITVSPLVTTDYYIRAEGICNTTLCANKIITVNDSSISASSATVSLDTICISLSTVLTANGGLLGTSASWYWYDGSCGGTFAGNGSPLTVSPTITTNYYVRAEGPCNTTPCVNLTVTVNDSSVSASSVTATFTTICEGGSTTLGLTGGILGTGGYWSWYTGSCGGNGLGIGSSVVDYPLVTTSYYLRAEGTCNTTSCVSIEITVNTNSTGTITGISSPDTICDGSIANLIITGGQLGTGGDWYWYTTSCGGTYEGAGSMFSVTPSMTTDYYVRAEGACNTTSCIIVHVTVKSNSTSADSIITTSSHICAGNSASLVISGGQPGTGGDWYWYSGSCGGTAEGNGTGITVSPIITTDYYVRGEGVCNTTACALLTITVNDSSITATTATATPDTICDGSTTTLGVSGGIAGTAADWYWYSGSCGGTLAGVGNPLTISPSVTANYYVRAEGICNTTSCINVTVTVKSNSTPVSSVTASSNPVCEGLSTTLGMTGGQLGTGGDWYWYSGNCGGIPEGVGTTITVSPTITTDYYVRGEGICSMTNCTSLTITVNDSSLIATATTAMPDTICNGLSTTISVSGGFAGSGADWYWYTGTCGGTLAGNGNPAILSPTSTTEYYVRAEGTCNTTGCINITIEVNTISLPVTSVTAIEPVICTGASTTLGITGGTLGTGADWYWYSGSCGGALLGNGLTQSVTPPVTEQYYVRAEGTCNTTICNSITVVLLPLPVSPVLLTSDINGFCSDAGGSINLNAAGGYGDSLIWYTGGCESAFIGNGTTINIPSPVLTTIYYAGWQTISCGNSACISFEVTVIPKPSDALTTGAVPDTISAGQSTILNVSGNLSAGEIWTWYENNCGSGSVVGTGSALEIYPGSTTVYYVRAENGLCYSNCTTAPLIIPGSLNSAGGITVSPSDTVCSGSSTTLGAVNGTSGGDWYWYENSCGGTFLGSGYIMVVYPTVATTYSVRQELGTLYSSCDSKLVHVKTLSTPALTISATIDTICSGQSSNLSFTGGFLGTSALWYWYSGSCGGSPAGNGTSITVSPVITTDYYIRAEGICNTTTCLNFVITVRDNSTQASSANSTLTTICAGSSTTLGVSGGFAGTGADWYWYTGSCGGTGSGIGNPVTVSPVITTNYYVRAEGICNTTPCVNISITVNDTSVSANTVTATLSTICEGSSTTLGITGGVTGTGADWYWYAGSCGGTPEGNSSNLTISPTITTNYYVRAEGICNTTNCVNITITVNDSTTLASSITASSSSITEGNSATLSSTGGILGTGADWYWYTGSCGGNAAGIGNPVTVSPSITTIYYLRGEGLCNTTQCINTTITVIDTSISASNITATLSTICTGNSTMLTIAGGTLGTGADWYWYSSTCGGIPAGNGDTLIVSPTVTTDYYVRAEGISNTTGCLNIIITLNTNSVLPSTISLTTDTIHIGDTNTLTLTGGSLGTSATWNWYTVGCGVTLADTGLTIAVMPTVTTVYFIRAEGLCNTTNCMTVEVAVIQGYSISGTLKYDQSNILLDSVKMYLRLNGNIIDSTRSDINGNYQFNLVPSGTYTITCKTGKTWGGVNSTDAVKVKRHFAGSEFFSTSLRLHAADVNLSMGINVTDAVKITRRFVGSDTLFTRPDWNFEKLLGGDTLNVSSGMNDTVIVNGTSITQDFKGICVGDVNGSYVPPVGAKLNSKVNLLYNEVKRLDAGEYFELPLRVSGNINIGAASLIMNYPKELLTIINVQSSVINENNNLFFNTNNNELRIGWFENEGSINLKNNETFIIIRGKTSSNFKTGDKIKFSLKNDALCELADGNGETIENVELNTYSIEHKNSLSSGIFAGNNDNEMTIYPNPAKDRITINYRLAEDGQVRIELFNLLGEKTGEILNQSSLKGSYNKEIDLTSLSSGIYTCKMTSADQSVIIKRLVISK